MKELSTYDIESTNWIDFEIACVYLPDKNKSLFSYSPQQLVRHMVDNAHKDRVYWAHNGGKFDVKFIIGILLENYDLSILPINGSLVKIAVYYKNSKKKLFEIRDSIPLLTRGFDDLIDSFSIPLTISRQKLADYKSRRDDIAGFSNEELKEYVEVDAIGLHDLLVKAKTVLGVDEFRLTTASTAFAEWREIVGDDEKLYRVDARHDEFFRESYCGGRVEVFEREGLCVDYVDVNSMYPFVMRNQPYPAGGCSRTKRFVEDKLGIYEVRVHAPDGLEIPLLPKKHDGKLLFPTGSWTGVYCSPELLKARDLGYEFEVLRGVVWEGCGKPFNEYIDKWHAVKTKAASEGDKCRKYIAKLYLNSLYGKFGQKRKHRKIKHGFTRKDLRNGCKPLFPEYGLYAVNEETRKPFTTCHIASFVTCYARLVLYDGFEQVQASGGRVLYCDTDSMICSATPALGSELGEWEVEESSVDAVCLLPKVYALHNDSVDVRKAKGFNTGDIQWVDYKNALSGDWSGFAYERDSVIGFFEAAARNKGILTTRTLSRTLQGLFSKRVLLENNKTKPINV